MLFEWFLLSLQPNSKYHTQRKMNKTLYALIALITVFVISSCDDYETYGEKKDQERDAINAFISNQKINVIDENTFVSQDSTTNLTNNEYVYLDNSGVYMQIVRKGAGSMIQDGQQVNLLIKYYEYNIKDTAYITFNHVSSSTYDKMSVTRSGSTYTASFISGMMYSKYGATVPSGWLVPLQYVKIGRQTSADEEIAKVRLIVPHSQGTSSAQSSVYPCFYEMTIQSEK